ncbi:MAG: ABC transporter permease, partial [Dehalococcoidia bacterium]|nr:ABC transporter permease [Dehalococcoidia bacterium]
AGLRITSTIALIGVVVGEMVGANTGLGYLTMVGSGLGKTALVFVAIFFLTLIGIVLYSAVVSLERWVLRWQQVG